VATHNIITRIALTPVIVRTNETPPTETFEQWYSDGPFEFDPTLISPLLDDQDDDFELYEFTITDTRPAVVGSEVTITVRARANFDDTDAFVAVYVAGQQVGLLWRYDGWPCGNTGLRIGTVVLTAGQWNTLRGDADTVVVGMRPRFQISLAHPCQLPQAKFWISYEVERSVHTGYRAFATLATSHKTLVRGAGESLEPHYHYAAFAGNRQTGKLIVDSVSAYDQHTLSGLGVARADSDGSQISGHPMPGSFCSISTGEVPGQAMRFKSVGQCAQE